MSHIEEEYLTKVYRSHQKGTTHVSINIEGEVPKGMIRRIQALIAESNKCLDRDKGLISYEIQTHRCPRQKMT